MHVMKLLYYKYISSMGSCAPANKYQYSVSTNYNKNMQVQKKYKILNKNTGGPMYQNDLIQMISTGRGKRGNMCKYTTIVIDDC